MNSHNFLMLKVLKQNCWQLPSRMFNFLTLKTKAAPCPSRFVLQNDEGVLKINREKNNFIIIINIKI